MALFINGTEINQTTGSVAFGSNTDLDEVYYNNVLVWKKIRDAFITINQSSGLGWHDNYFGFSATSDTSVTYSGLKSTQHFAFEFRCLDTSFPGWKYSYSYDTYTLEAIYDYSGEDETSYYADMSYSDVMAKWTYKLDRGNYYDRIANEFFGGEGNQNNGTYTNNLSDGYSTGKFQFSPWLGFYMTRDELFQRVSDANSLSENIRINLSMNPSGSLPYEAMYSGRWQNMRTLYDAYNVTELSNRFQWRIASADYYSDWMAVTNVPIGTAIALHPVV